MPNHHTPTHTIQEGTVFTKRCNTKSSHTSRAIYTTEHRAHPYGRSGQRTHYGPGELLLHRSRTPGSTHRRSEETPPRQEDRRRSNSTRAPARRDRYRCGSHRPRRPDSLWLEHEAVYTSAEHAQSANLRYSPAPHMNDS